MQLKSYYFEPSLQYFSKNGWSFQWLSESEREDPKVFTQLQALLNELALIGSIYQKELTYHVTKRLSALTKPRKNVITSYTWKKTVMDLIYLKEKTLARKQKRPTVFLPTQTVMYQACTWLFWARCLHSWLCHLLLRIGYQPFQVTWMRSTHLTNQVLKPTKKNMFALLSKPGFRTWSQNSTLVFNRWMKRSRKRSFFTAKQTRFVPWN